MLKALDRNVVVSKELLRRGPVCPEEATVCDAVTAHTRITHSRLLAVLETKSDPDFFRNCPFAEERFVAVRCGDGLWSARQSLRYRG